MLFNSYEFIIFFPIVILLYFALPHRFRWVMLLVSSYVFYMAWRAEYIILIIASTLVDYFMSILMDKTENQKKKKAYLFVSLVVNLGLLFVFKYFNFLNETVTNLMLGWGRENPVNNFSLLLPMGISFYTFQTLSYSIDVYKGKRKAERHIGYFALYVSYFPQLVAGPIERSDRLLPQLKMKHIFEYDRARMGLQRMLWGFFQKIVIADTVAVVVNNVYNSPQNFGGLAFIIATLGFALQIYCDFAGYTNIAIGCAQIMGIEIMENFRQPYFAVSIKDFWSRWHISLSTWFRDYVYIPLGGNRVGKVRKHFNVFITFLLSGLWHGANWTFVLWGAIHGFLRVIEDGVASIFRKRNYELMSKKPKLKRILDTIIIFAIVSFAWIFFRANSIGDAFYIVGHLFEGIGNWASPSYLNMIRNDIGLHFISVIVPLLFGLFLMGIMWVVREKGKNPYEVFSRKNVVFRWSVYIILSLIIIFKFALSDTTAQFIYFQF